MVENLAKNELYLFKCMIDLSVSTTRINQVCSIVFDLLNIFFTTLFEMEHTYTLALVDSIIKRYGLVYNGKVFKS